MAMAIPLPSLLFTLFALHLFFGLQAGAVISYDYSYTIGCVGKAVAPQYGGGILVNPELNNGLDGWVSIGNARLKSARSSSGNFYVEISNILQVRSDGISQFFPLDKENFYIVSAWVKANTGETAVQAKLVASTGNITAGWATAKSGCWSMLKGGFTGNLSEVVEIRFESNSTGVDVWLDNISLQPFTREEWALHQNRSVEKVRKTRVKLEVGGENRAHAAITIKQRQPHFPFGCAMNELIVEKRDYQKWFLEKGFKYTAFENELKWLSTEKTKGVENYTVPDAMLDFCKSNNISVRGHNILWDDEDYQPHWVKPLCGDELKMAAIKRVNSVVKRYRGDFIHWDVINENFHNDFLSKVTRNGSQVFELVRHLDPRPLPFLNEYSVIEGSSLMGRASPQIYLQRIEQMRGEGYGGPLGVGLEGHFDTYVPNIPYVRATIDMFAATGLPVWITELTVNTSLPNQTEYLEALLRELHSHAAVKGIILWSALGHEKLCYSMCLTDNDYKNVPAGDIVDKFMGEFIEVEDTIGTTDAHGLFEALLFYGEYEATVTLRSGATMSFTFDLVPDERDVVVFRFNI